VTQRKQRLVEAYLYERTIDAQTYQEQLDRLREEAALAQMELHDARLDELEVESVLNFATYVLSNASRFWSECSLEQKQRFQSILFPEGLRFDGESFGTAVTCIAFNYLRDVSARNANLASRTGVEPVSPP
jgi:hypothetical protein